MTTTADPRLRLKCPAPPRKDDKGHIITNFWYRPWELDIPEHSRLELHDPKKSVYQPGTQKSRTASEVVAPTPASPDKAIGTLPMADERAKLPTPPQEELKVVTGQQTHKPPPGQPLPSPSLSVETHDSEASLDIPSRLPKRVRFNSHSTSQNHLSPRLRSPTAPPIFIEHPSVFSEIPDDTTGDFCESPVLEWSFPVTPSWTLHDPQAARRRNSLQETATYPIFVNQSGVPSKFFLVPGTGNQCLQTILQHGGTSTNLSNAYYIIFPTTILSHDNAPFFALLHGHQVAVSAGWIQACMESGSRVEISPYVVRRPPRPTAPFGLSLNPQHTVDPPRPYPAPFGLATTSGDNIRRPYVLEPRSRSTATSSPEVPITVTERGEQAEKGTSLSRLARQLPTPIPSERAWAINTWRNSQPAHTLEPQALPRRDSKTSSVKRHSETSTEQSHLSDVKIGKRAAPPTVKHIDSVLDTLTAQKPRGRPRDTFKIPRRRLSDKMRKSSSERVRKRSRRSSDSKVRDGLEGRSVEALTAHLSSELFDGDLSDLDIESGDESDLLSETSSIMEAIHGRANAKQVCTEQETDGAEVDMEMNVDATEGPSSKGRAVRKQIQARKSLTVTLQEAAKRQLDCKFWAYVSEDEEEEPTPIPTKEEVMGRPRLTRSGRKLD